MNDFTSPRTALLRALATVALPGAALIAFTVPVPSHAQDDGGLYIAGAGFSFEQAANRALAQNARGTRFFVLALPPAASALTTAAPAATAALRDRVTAQGGVLLVCQRDLDKKLIDAARLAPKVVAVRGFAAPGSNAMAPGERYFPDENRDVLPQSNEALRRLRSNCS
jgi:hypothetical protein